MFPGLENKAVILQATYTVHKNWQGQEIDLLIQAISKTLNNYSNYHCSTKGQSGGQNT